MKTRHFVLLPAILFAAFAVAQTAPAPGRSDSPKAPASPAPAAAAPKAQNQADAYYHFALAHMYEEMATMNGRSEYATKAAEEYRLAIQSDPTSEYLNGALAELYARTGRIRDAVLEAQDIIKRDPGNVEARRLLGRIYLRSLGDMQVGSASTEVLKRALEQYEAIVKLQPDSVDDHLLLGRLYRLNNELAKAENEFNIAIKLQPYSEEAVTTLAYLYNEEGNSEKAAKVLSTIPDAGRSARLYSALGFTYEKQQDYRNAVAAYRKAVELDRDNLDAMRGLAQNLMNDGQNDAALEQFKAIAEADPQDPQNYLRMAELYRRTGKFDLALESLKKAQNYAQDSQEISYNTAIVYQAQGRFDEAIALLQELVRKSEKPDGNYSAGERNNRSIFLTRLGTIYRENGKYQLAIETFRQMMNLGDEEVSHAFQDIVDTYREAKMWPQAAAAAKEGAAKLPNDRNLKVALAMQLADSGQVDRALSDVKGMLKGTPDDRDLYLDLAQMNSRAKRFKDAGEYIAKAAQLSSKPEEKSQVWYLWGDILQRQKKYAEAEEMFKKVLAVDPSNAGVLNYLGYMLADRGVRLEEALGYVKKAVELDPQRGEYLDSLGWAYFKLGDYDLAEVNLRRASERIGNDPTIQEHLGELCAKTGRLKLAAAHWERAVEEWNRSTPADVDQDDFQRVQKKLESAKVKLAKQQQAERKQ